MYVRTYTVTYDVVSHHLCDTEAVSEVVEWVVPVVLLDPHQPAFEDDGVDVEVVHKAQLPVHMLEEVQHLDKKMGGQR